MKSGEVRLAGFGTFTSAKRAARNGVNPQTGRKIRIPARRVPKFRPAQELKNKCK
jgi:DNA-binding protein HU-beta